MGKIHICTGDGTRKITAALGLVLRAIGKAAALISASSLKAGFGL